MPAVPGVPFALAEVGSQGDVDAPAAACWCATSGMDAEPLTWGRASVLHAQNTAPRGSASGRRKVTLNRQRPSPTCSPCGGCSGLAACRVAGRYSSWAQERGLRLWLRRQLGRGEESQHPLAARRRRAPSSTGVAGYCPGARMSLRGPSAVPRKRRHGANWTSPSRRPSSLSPLPPSMPSYQTFATVIHPSLL